MKRIKKFIDVQVPIEGCTLRCHYCYVTHHRLFNNKTPDFKYDVEIWKKAFDQERWGGPCMVNFCAAGETLLYPPMVDYIEATLNQGHYVMVVTNGTINNAFIRMSKFSKDNLNRLFFKFSYHYQQLVERNLLDKFFDNVRMMRAAGASFTLELTPHDELIAMQDNIKAVAEKEVGAWPHVTVARDEHYMDELPILTALNRQDYIKAWGIFDSSLFDFKMSIFNEKRKEFCYAGVWTFALEMGTGILKQCYRSYFNQNILEDPTKPIVLHSIGHFCKEAHCFNGHAWIGFGTVPTLNAPTFSEMRNRCVQDGTSWLTNTMNEAMQTKLKNTNSELNCLQKIGSDIFIILLIIKKQFLKSIRLLFKF